MRIGPGEKQPRRDNPPARTTELGLRARRRGHAAAPLAIITRQAQPNARSEARSTHVADALNPVI